MGRCVLFHHVLSRLAMALGLCAGMVVGFGLTIASASGQVVLEGSCASPLSASVGVRFTGSNFVSSADSVPGLCAPTSSPVWYSFVPLVSGTHTISLCGSAIDSVATLFDTCGGQILACDDNTCGDDAVLTAQLTAGLTYRLRIASAGASGPVGMFTGLITAPSVPGPSNDNCGQSIPIPGNTRLTASNAGAIGSDISACGASDTSDVWFSFVPTVLGPHRVEVCTQAFAPVVSLHQSCLSPTSTACASNVSVAGCGTTGAALTFSPNAVGQPVLIRVAGVRSSFGSFDIIVHTAQSNDSCSSPQLLSLAGPSTGVTTPVLSTDTSVPCAVSGADVWFAFIPPATGAYVFSSCASSFDTVLSVHSACPSVSGSTILACADDNCGSRARLTAVLNLGSIYYIRLAGKGSPPAFGAYSLSVERLLPSNDECASATTIFPGTTINASNFGATGTDITPCGSADNKDVWFALTPAVSGMYELNTCGSSISTTLSVFSDCSTTLLACSDVTPTYCGGFGLGSSLTLPLTSGVRYLIRVAGIASQEGDFTLTSARRGEIADECPSATPIALNTLVSATTGGATPSGQPSCNIGDAPDVWFSFVPPTSRFYAISTCGSVLDDVVSLHTVCGVRGFISCASGGPDCGRGSPGATLTEFLQAGTTYRIRVAAKPGRTVGESFLLMVTPAAPPNSDCAAPVPLQLNTSTFGSNIGADLSTTIAGCASGDSKPVWFSFSPSISGTYQLSTCGNPTTINTVVSIHTACGAMAIACNDNDVANCGTSGPSRAVARLSAGQTYLVRVAGVSGAEGTFFVTPSTAAPSNDVCANATPVGEGQFPFDTLAATTDALFVDTTCGLGFNLLSNDVWFRYTATRQTLIAVDVCGASFDTAMTVSLGGACPTGTYAALACNDDAVCLAGSTVLSPQSRVTFQTTVGQSYLIRVGSRLTNATGSGMLTIGPANPCPCDFNSSGRVTVEDIFAFLSAWFARSPAADFNGMGGITVQDIFDFLSCFFSRPNGCTY